MTTTYPYGYGNPPQRLTMADLETKATVRNAHPEFWRRLRAMLIAGDGRLGIGTLWRSSDLQRDVFLQRHSPVASGGCCSYDGGRYALDPGNAHAAPPGRSFHEGIMNGTAAALDAIGDLVWMHANEAAYGFKDFRNVGNEPWHLQFVELPNSVSAWIKAGSPEPTIWTLPAEPTPPTPTPPKDDDMLYLATLSDGTVVIAGSAIRPVSGDEIAPGGPLADLPRYVPKPDSNWHAWLRAGSDEYSARVMG